MGSEMCIRDRSVAVDVSDIFLLKFFHLYFRSPGIVEKRVEWKFLTLELDQAVRSTEV